MFCFSWFFLQREMPPRGKMMKVFLSSCVPWPQGSTCPHTVHCWQLDFCKPLGVLRLAPSY